MEIRAAQKQDLAQMLDIYNAEVMDGVATLDLTPWDMDQWREWFAQHRAQGRPVLAAAEGQRVLGYASLSEFRSKEAYRSTAELSVYVARSARGQGVASALMAEILDHARRDEGLHNVVSVITGGNEASVRLHEKFRFAYCGTVPQVGEKFGRYLDVVYYSLIV